MFFRRLGRSVVIAFSVFVSVCLSLFLSYSVFLSLLLFLIPSLAQADWNIYTIQRLDHFSYWYPIHSLALDDQGCAHLAYGTDNLNYTYSLSSEDNFHWLVEVVEDLPNPVDIKGFATIALDAVNNPHLCYISHGCLIYAHKKEINWSFKTIDDSLKNCISLSISMALDSQGSVYISYYNCEQQKLIYVSFNENERESIGGGNESESSGESESESIDESGTDSGGDNSEGDNGVIVKQVVDYSDDVGSENSLALDLSGNVHIAYYDKSQQDLKYACKKKGGDWTIEVVDSTGDVGSCPALAVDRDGHPCISYCDWTNRNLKYARRGDQGWITETIDASSNHGGEFTSIALDRNGRPHISYFNRSAHALMYTVYNGKTWQTQLASENEDIDGATSLALDSSGQARIIYYNYTNDLLKYATLEEDTPTFQGDAFNKGYECFLSAIKIF
jgi:hypothetical protein